MKMKKKYDCKYPFQIYFNFKTLVLWPKNQEIQVYLEDVMPFKICLRWSYQFADIARYPLNDTCKQYNQ